MEFPENLMEISQNKILMQLLLFKRIISVHSNGMIKLWEVDKEKLIYTLQLNGPIYRFITNKLYFEGFNGTLIIHGTS